MKKYVLVKIVAMLVAAFASMSFILQPEGTGWRGPDRDGRVSGFEIPNSASGKLQTEWQISVGLGDASPVLSNGKIYLHTRKRDAETALCIDAATGKIVWEQANNPAPEVTGGASGHPGPRSTPAVAYGKVFNVGAGGHVTCRDSESGKLIWESAEFTEEVPQFFVSCSPLITGSKCIVHLNGKEKGTVVAFDVQTGAKLWTLPGEASTYSSPLLMPVFENMIVVQGESDLLGISAIDGKLLWKFPTPAESRFYNSSTPVVDGDKLYIAGQGSGIRAIQVKKSDNGYECNEMWNNPAMGVSFNTPVLKDGLLYGNEARFGNVFCMRAGNGELCWTDTTKHLRFASVQDAGSVLVSLPSNGMLLVYKPDAVKYNPNFAFKVADTEVYAHPILDRKRVFVKDKEHLTSWILE